MRVFLYVFFSLPKNTAIAEKREENPEILANLARKSCDPPDLADESVMKGQAFMRKPLYLFTGSVAQGTINAALEMLTQLQLGKAPHLDGSADDFSKRVHAHLPYFVHWSSGRGSGSGDGPEILYGKDALVKMWDALKGVELATLEWTKLQPFITYGFLLEEKMRADVMGKLDGVIKSKASRKRPGGACKPPVKKHKNGIAEEEAQKAANAIFNR